jgi:uracil-DNA glycosylase
MRKSPKTRNLSSVRVEARRCRNCPLWKNATQTVFGEGRQSARIMFIGEQPGDVEDRRGKPFVGPAGKLLDQALIDAGISRPDCYFTNAVKHFKWEPRGKRRIHKKPSPREVAACRPWLEAELGLVKPAIIVCLGATAVAAVMGPAIRVLRDRGKLLPSPLAKSILVTIHPSAMLRMPDRELAKKEYQRFVRDLTVAALA